MTDSNNKPGDTRQVVELGFAPAGTRIVNLNKGLALVVARGGANAGLRKQLREKLVATTRRRDGQRCGFHGAGCKGHGLIVLACHEPGYPMVVRCEAHMGAAPRGGLFMGFIVPAAGASAASGLAREAVASEADNMRKTLRAAVTMTTDPDVERATAEASAGDRGWFKEHGNRNHYLRPARPAELLEAGASADTPAFVAVQQVDKAMGFHLRCVRPCPNAIGLLHAYDQLDDAQQEAVAEAFALEVRAEMDPGLKHHAEVALERAWRMLEGDAA